MVLGLMGTDRSGVSWIAYDETGSVSAAMHLERITVDPAVATGKPCIRGLRFPVSRLLGLLASGETRESVCGSLPEYLQAERHRLGRCATASHWLRMETVERQLMKFLVDMALSPQLAAWLGSQGHDAMHASELSLDRRYRSLKSCRVVVTADLDFPRLLATLYATGPGLILLRGGNYSEREAVGCSGKFSGRSKGLRSLSWWSINAQCAAGHYQFEPL